ncbi:MAG: neutral zinc metallopeptidase [Elainellaceae cyanobacterium]
MRWEFGRRSTNVEDRRGMRPSRGVVGGGLGALLLALLVALLGGDPSMVFNQSPGYDGPAQVAPAPPQDDQAAAFVSTVLGYTEDTWEQIFREKGSRYVEPKLVLFSGVVNSGCGTAQSSMGPFYCPLDQKVYLDMSFYNDMQRRLGAGGDFAYAYVIAHEVGHHVQNLLGISDQVQSTQRRVSKTQANQLSVRLELQADCFAGVWAHRTQQAQQFLERGDIEEALNAAAAIGDDRLQKQAQGYVVPDSFTHGSSAQRVRWFTKGIETGDVNQCNTFEATTL